MNAQEKEGNKCGESFSHSNESSSTPIQKIIGDDAAIHEIERFVQEGRRVTFSVKGYSMLPFIAGWLESVELTALKREPKRGDALLAYVNGTHYALHRVIASDPTQKTCTLMGDGNLRGTEHCRYQDIVALAEYVIDAKGKKRYLYTPWRMRGWQVWMWLLPVRRWLLAVYRRIKYRKLPSD